MLTRNLCLSLLLTLAAVLGAAPVQAHEGHWSGAAYVAPTLAARVTAEPVVALSVQHLSYSVVQAVPTCPEGDGPCCCHGDHACGKSPTRVLAPPVALLCFARGVARHVIASDFVAALSPSFFSNAHRTRAPPLLVS